VHCFFFFCFPPHKTPHPPPPPPGFSPLPNCSRAGLLWSFVLGQASGFRVSSPLDYHWTNTLGIFLMFFLPDNGSEDSLFRPNNFIEELSQDSPGSGGSLETAPLSSPPNIPSRPNGTKKCKSSRAQEMRNIVSAGPRYYFDPFLT